MDTMRERVLSRLAIFAEGKPADETADAIMAIVAEDREKLVACLKPLVELIYAHDRHGEEKSERQTGFSEIQRDTQREA